METKTKIEIRNATPNMEKNEIRTAYMGDQVPGDVKNALEVLK